MNSICRAERQEMNEEEKGELLTELKVDVRYIKSSLQDLKECIEIMVNKDELDRIALAMERRMSKVEKSVEILMNFRFWILGILSVLTVGSEFVYHVIFK